MCQVEGMSLQRGMNFRPRGRISVILMSVRKGAPYADRLEADGQILIYEGHNIDRSASGPDPRLVDQRAQTEAGTPTQNGRFPEAAKRHNQNGEEAEPVRVYEKIKAGIWVFNGIFALIDGWQEDSGPRKVFKFKLELQSSGSDAGDSNVRDISHERVIPSDVKLEVWKRDEGKCIQCGKTDNLHFDHILPFSKGGTSLLAENIQLLCARHNLEKSDQIR